MYKTMFLYKETHRYLKKDYQFFEALKTKEHKIGSRTIAPEEPCPPTPKLTLTQTLTLTRG